MTVSRFEKSSRTFALVAGSAAVLLVSGCTGTKTYGTGKTQEAQLADDLLGIAMLGQSKKDKPRIEYMSRPGLVKPPTTAALPQPVDASAAQSDNFPKDPELRRAALLKEIEEAEARGEKIPEEAAALRRASIGRPDGKVTSAREEDLKFWTNNPEEARKARELFLARKKANAGASGSAPRKYLTEPKAVYRTPAETAPVGVLGEKERDPNAKKKSSLWEKLTGGSKKKSGS